MESEDTEEKFEDQGETTTHARRKQSPGINQSRWTEKADKPIY